eukprot:7290443-Pyramimonas_sp.AAC.1
MWGPRKPRPSPEGRLFILSRFSTVPEPGEGPCSGHKLREPSVLFFFQCVGYLGIRAGIDRLPGHSYRPTTSCSQNPGMFEKTQTMFSESEPEVSTRPVPPRH